MFTEIFKENVILRISKDKIIETYLHFLQFIEQNGQKNILIKLTILLSNTNMNRIH